MNPFVNSLLAVVFVICGAGAVGIMLELHGAPKDRPANTFLIRLHKILGWLFTAIFVFLVIVMIIKVSGYKEEVSARTALHIVLSLALVPLLCIKIMVARRYVRLSRYLVAFGPVALGLGVALSGLGAGYYFMHASDLKYVALTAADSPILDETLGRQVVNQRCSKCHTLERVFRSVKTQAGWAATINRMAALDAPNISSFDIKQAIHFLTRRQKPVKEEDTAGLHQQFGKTVLETKCVSCHSRERIVRADKGREQWEKTIRRMIKHSKDPAYLTDDEKDALLEHLM
ncbi:MAG TPA: hypothetical protein VJ959_14595 [Desulfotignum sp.]|nr:hypothetical protein [Desulfotignum sp.]